nr:immunoglobulin heavy chain junction region [Mus musculus]
CARGWISYYYGSCPTAGFAYW